MRGEEGIPGLPILDRLPPRLKERMAERKLAHAYLITGQARDQLADALTAAWVCSGERPPCLACPGCRKARLGIHPDVTIADREGEGLKAEAARDLRADAFVLPNEANAKVYRLEHGELLNPTVQNILLKLIEEGPPYACFLVLAPNPEQLLPTIRSRCETLYAPGPEVQQANGDAETLVGLIVSGASDTQRLPFLVSLEKKERRELILLLQASVEQLTALLPERPDLLPVVGRLRTLIAAGEFNISAGHLSGWLASLL